MELDMVLDSLVVDNKASHILALDSMDVDKDHNMDYDRSSSLKAKMQ